MVLIHPQGFRRYTHAESIRLFKPFFVKAAQALVPQIQSKHLIPSRKVGIRPQLFDRQSQSLVMDFRVVRTERSTHILNAVSPAFTSAFNFSRFVLDNEEWPQTPLVLTAE